MPGSHRLEQQAAYGVHIFAVAYAEGYAFYEFRQIIPGPDNSSGFRKFRKVLKPYRIIGREFVFASSLLNKQIAAAFFQREGYLPGREFA